MKSYFALLSFAAIFAFVGCNPEDTKKVEDKAKEAMTKAKEGAKEGMEKAKDAAKEGYKEAKDATAAGVKKVEDKIDQMQSKPTGALPATTVQKPTIGSEPGSTTFGGTISDGPSALTPTKPADLKPALSKPADEAKGTLDKN